MAHVLALDEVDDVLGDVARVVGDLRQAGEAEIEFAKTGATRQEVEFTVRNVDPGVNFTFVIDGIDVASATSNQRGRADVELDVRMP